jgi:hypothetical protein
MMKKDEDDLGWCFDSLNGPESIKCVFLHYHCQVLKTLILAHIMLFSLDTPNPLLNDVTRVSAMDVIGALSGLRSLQNDLANFSKLLGERVKSLKKDYKLQIVNAGINSIPPEILSEIFQHACSSDSGGTRFAFTISQVCRRFRVAAVHTLAIWTTITNDLPSKWIKLCLARSVSLPLAIHINDETHEILDKSSHAVSSQDIPNFISLISPARNRWQSFTYFEPEFEANYILENEILNGEQFMRIQLPLLRSTTSKMSFPTLQVLSVAAPDALFDQEKYGEMFFSSWACPQLTSFHGNGVLPYLSLSNTLTMCSLHLRNDYHSIHPVNNFGDFPEYLASFTSLKKLIFHLEIVEDDEPQIDSLDLGYPSMNDLEELHIIYERTDDTIENIRREGFDSVHFFKSMFAHMELPALKILTCEFVLEGNVFRNIQEVLPVASRCPNLRRLTLKHRLFRGYYTGFHRLAEYVTAGPVGMDFLFPLFPQIHHLELDGSELCQFSQEIQQDLPGIVGKFSSTYSLPPLRTITICRDTEELFTLELINRLRCGNYWDLFDTLNLKEMQGVISYPRIRSQLGVKNLVVVE